MTSLEIVGFPIDTFPVETVAALTDAQLDEHLSKYFPYTRPGPVATGEQIVGAKMMELAGKSSLADKIKAAQEAQEKKKVFVIKPNKK